ncbi:MAG TPA: hypothetical protein VG426_08725 [Candidatus Dormibacteraeota bacterium]|nr:hypothetical protein [Candidatus Dormibacteraeota bacterium]
MQHLPKEPLQALTLRLPKSEYRLVRALAFATDESINDVVGTAVRRLLDDPEIRPTLDAIINDARALRPRRRVPRNPHGKGRAKPAT